MKNRTNEQLCALAQKGDAGARSLLLEQNMGFLRKTAGELYRSMNLAQSDLCVDCEDLVQEGSIGLLSAAAGFDAARGIKFLTYAAPAIRNAMTDFIRAEFSQFEQKVVHGENELGIQIIRLEDVRSEEEQAQHAREVLSASYRNCWVLHPVRRGAHIPQPPSKRGKRNRPRTASIE